MWRGCDGGILRRCCEDDCVADLFYGTDYHSHLGTVRGGMAVGNGNGFTRFIKDITNAQFRSKFEDDLAEMHGTIGIGVISDYEDQPLIIGSHLGTYALVTVGRIENLDELAAEVFEQPHGPLLRDERRRDQPHRTGRHADQPGETASRRASGMPRRSIEGSCSLLLLTDAASTPPATGWAARRWSSAERTAPAPSRWKPAPCRTWATRSSATSGPGEIVRITADGVETLQPPGETMQICSFLWVYYGYPGLELRGDQRRGGPQPLRRGPGPGRRRASRPGGRHSRLGHRPRHRLRQRRRASPTGGRSSSTRRPGRGASCRRTNGSATWSPG